MSESLTVTARWVFPGDAPPLECGLVTVADGVVAAVEPAGSRTADHDFGDAAIIPGLVNAHTHLDLTGAKGQIPPSPDFVGWLRGVIAFRQARLPEQVCEDIRNGATESFRHGTTLCGDIAAGQEYLRVLKGEGRWTIFHELIGLTRRRANEVWQEANRVTYGGWMAETHPTGIKLSRGGLSPHAPYSVNTQLFRRVANHVRNKSTPVAIHLAESQAEIELLRGQSGPFRTFLQDLRVWEPHALVKDAYEVLSLFCDVRTLLLVHCNYLAPDAPIPPNGTVVYCPRTHAAFGHPPHPFRDFLARGVRVALGTDSLASNPDLSVLSEMRFVHARHPDVPGATLLRMATLAGAEGLGWADETGSLTPGKSADFAVVPLPAAEAPDPHLLLLESDYAVRETWFRGRRVAPD